MDAFIVLLIVVTVQVQISSLTSVQIFNVLPDDSTTESCPCQPRATLSQYLLDNNSTLPFVSNVEHHFLPGEQYLCTRVILKHLRNFTFFGVTSNSSSPPKLVCCYSLSDYQLIIRYSNQLCSSAQHNLQVLQHV